MKVAKPTEPFPDSLKTFARSLHFLSPKAYEWVRKSFLKCLPCVETLNRWDSSRNFEPGILEEVLEHISQFVKEIMDRISSDNQNENENAQKKKADKRPIFNITFDEMHIKKLETYCRQTKK